MSDLDDAGEARARSEEDRIFARVRLELIVDEIFNALADIDVLRFWLDTLDRRN